MRVRLLAAVVSLGLSACVFTNMSANQRLQDSVRGLNNELRWSRVTRALEHVDPGYREAFTRSHRGWGEAKKIADTELVEVKLAEDKNHATSFVTYRWYSYEDMTLRTTTLQQRWKHTRGEGFLLTKEEVMQGSGVLLGRSKRDTAGGEAPQQPKAKRSRGRVEGPREPQ
jgi:hypothetical protein